MKSYDAKEWDRLTCSSADSLKKKVKRAKIETKVLTTNKKIKKVTLKELFSRGTFLLNTDDHNEEVRVTCEVMDVVTAFEDALKKYDPENHT